jgi:hypothetical protein
VACFIRRKVKIEVEKKAINGPFVPILPVRISRGELENQLQFGLFCLIFQVMKAKEAPTNKG